MKNRNSKKKKNRANKKGFSLVELLAVIIIVGIISVLAIAGVSRYISSARKEKINQDKKNIVMATQLYMQSNRDQLPKLIGDTAIVNIKVLREKNYLKEDVKNAAGETCMEKSFVRVYMLDEDEYSYTAYLYCGNDEVPDEVDVPEPVVLDFEFTGGNKTNGKFNDVKDAKFSFKIKGAERDDTIGIYSYSYTIFIRTKENEPYTEVFNSGVLKGGLESVVSVKSQPLSSYMSLTGYNNVRVDVTAINEQGGKLDYTTSTGDYEDKEAPICGEVTGEAIDDNDWINKTTFGADGSVPSGQTRAYPGRVTVNCSDGLGSGCKRDKFTRSWPNNSKSVSGIDYKLGARWSYVLLEDNAGETNSTKCYVRANVDVQAPEVKVTVYNAKTKEVIKTITVKDTDKVNSIMPDGTIKSNELKGAQGTGTEKWLNLETIGTTGIYLDVEIKDNLYLYSYEWKVNDPYVEGGTDDKVIASTASTGNVSGEGGTAATGTFESTGMTDNPTSDAELKTAEHGALSGTIKNLKIVREGKRYGELKVCDKAKNCTTVRIYANIDITPPLVPDTSYEKITSKTGYDPADVNNYKDHEHWSNEYVRPYINGQRDDKETQNVSVKAELSGWDQFIYSYSQQTGKNGTNYIWKNPVTKSIKGETNGRYGFDITDEGTHIVTFKSCDKAGNCSANSVDDYVKVDTIKPTCDTVTKYTGNNGNDIGSTIKGEVKNSKIGSANGSGWLKIGENVTLSHACADEDSQLSSGCDVDDYHNRQTFSFKSDIDTTAAGANGYNTTYGPEDNTAGGHVVDYAGNMSEECPKITVKIDHTIPVCTTNISWPEGEPLHPTTAGKPETGWLGLVNGTGPGKKTAKVAKVCNDPTSTSGLMTGVHSLCDDEGKYDSNKYNQKYHIYGEEMWITDAGAEGKANGGIVIDIAGNTGKCPTDRTVKIDYTAPVCNTKIEYGTRRVVPDEDYTVDMTLNPNAKPNSFGWQGWYSEEDIIREVSKVSQVCTDPNGEQKSGCYGDMKYKIYASEINVGNAGAVGVGDNGDVYDTAGNKTNCNSAPMYTVKIDYTRPVCEVDIKSTGSASTTGNNNEIPRDWNMPEYDGKWLGVGAKVSIHSTCTKEEDGKGTSSGCNTDETKDYTAEISTTQATTGGDNVPYYVYDKADNRSAEECERKTVRIDLSGPTCTLESRFDKSVSNSSPIYSASSSGYQGWLDGSYSVRVTSQCTGDNLRNGLVGSGCKETEIHFKDYSAAKGTVLNSFKGSKADGGSYDIYDMVGNKTTCGTKQVKIDNQAPTCNVSSKTSDGASYSGAWTNKSVIVSRVCNDGSGSGCDAAASAPQSATYTTSSYESYNDAGAISRKDSGKIKDNVGNETICAANQTVKLDVTPPTCTVSKSGTTGSWTNGNVTIQGNCSDTGSGCKTTSAQLKVTFSSDTYNTSYNYSKTITDNAGNSSTCSSGPYSIMVQKSKPSCMTYKETWSWYNPDGVTVNINCYPAGSPSPSAPLVSCAGSGGISTNFGLYSAESNLKTSKSYTVKDAAGNTGTCSVTVTAVSQNRTKTCSTCKRCSSATCQTYKSCVNSSCTSYKCNPTTKHGCYSSSQSGKTCSKLTSLTNSCAAGKYWCEWTAYDTCYNSCRSSKCDCETYNRNCSKCGCESGLSDWTNWKNGSQSAGWNGNTLYEKRTVYV